MTDEQNAAPIEADETPVEEQAETQEGQAEEGGQQPEPEADAGDNPEELSESQKRRERRKAKMAELYSAAEEAKARKERQEAIWEGGEEPVEANYDDLTEFAIDKALYRERQRQMQAQTAQVEAEMQAIDEARKQESAQYWQEQAAEARGRYQDFDRIALGNHWNPTPAMFEAITTSDKGADVAYWLGSNAHVAAQISQLPPAQQIREIGRIEATLSMPQPKTATKAPEPITPVKPRGTAQKDPSKMTMAEYRAWVKKRGG